MSTRALGTIDLDALFTTLLVLKLTHAVEFSWWVVVASLGASALVIFLGGMAKGFRKARKKKKKKSKRAELLAAALKTAALKGMK